MTLPQLFVLAVMLVAMHSTFLDFCRPPQPVVVDGWTVPDRKLMELE